MFVHNYNGLCLPKELTIRSGSLKSKVGLANSFAFFYGQLLLARIGKRTHNDKVFGPVRIKSLIQCHINRALLSSYQNLFGKMQSCGL